MADAWTQTAEAHDQALQADDKAGWEATLSPDQVGASSRGFWWKAGRDMVGKFGVKYVFDHLDERFSTDQKKKLFFKRLHPDGSQRGMPVPIHVVIENGAWKVAVASY
jgi:hypothetical protein